MLVSASVAISNSTFLFFSLLSDYFSTGCAWHWESAITGLIIGFVYGLGSVWTKPNKLVACELGSSNPLCML